MNSVMCNVKLPAGGGSGTLPPTITHCFHMKYGPDKRKHGEFNPDSDNGVTIFRYNVCCFCGKEVDYESK